MTEDDIVRMARESGLASPVMTAEGNSLSMGKMTRFAELVSELLREQIMKLHHVGYPHNLNREDILMAYRIGFRDARRKAAELASPGVVNG